MGLELVGDRYRGHSGCKTLEMAAKGAESPDFYAHPFLQLCRLPATVQCKIEAYMINWPGSEISRQLIQQTNSASSGSDLTSYYLRGVKRKRKDQRGLWIL